MTVLHKYACIESYPDLLSSSCAHVLSVQLQVRYASASRAMCVCVCLRVCMRGRGRGREHQLRALYWIIDEQTHPFLSLCPSSSFPLSLCPSSSFSSSTCPSSSFSSSIYPSSSCPLLPLLSFFPSSLLPSIILTLYLTNTHKLSVLTGRLHLSDRAHIVFDFHQAIDGLNEAKLGDKKLGEKWTSTAIFCLCGRVSRKGLRFPLVTWYHRIPLTLPYHPPSPVPQAPPTRASDPLTPLRPCVTASASVTYATWSSLRPGSEVLSSSSKVRLCVVWCSVSICLSKGCLSVCSMPVSVCVFSYGSHCSWEKNSFDLFIL